MDQLFSGFQTAPQASAQWSTPTSPVVRNLMTGLSISSSLPTGTVPTNSFLPMFRFFSALHLFILSVEQSVELSAQVGEGEADSEEIGGGDEHHHWQVFSFPFCWQWDLTLTFDIPLGTRSVVWHFRLLSLAWVWAGASSPMLDCLGGVNTLALGILLKILTLGPTLWSSWMLQRRSPSNGVALVRRGENIAHFSRNGKETI